MPFAPAEGVPAEGTTHKGEGVASMEGAVVERTMGLCVWSALRQPLICPGASGIEVYIRPSH